MKYPSIIHRALLICSLSAISYSSPAHDIYFCGERIPVDDKLIADKLMNFIKSMTNYVNFPTIRQNIGQYMPQVESWLKATYLPQDFKYLAIVESGFKTDVSSKAGAVGFWQLMRSTATDWGLSVDGPVDERTDFDKSTYAACRKLAADYILIRKTFGINSWVLTAAAYNVGIGRIIKTVKSEGNNYFTMNLNPETAAYVYKIIAIKELYEYPELYMNKFGCNIFTCSPSSVNAKDPKILDTDISAFKSMKVDVNESDGNHPLVLKQGTNTKVDPYKEKTRTITAKISGKYKNIVDGGNIKLILEDDLQVQNVFLAKGNEIMGWTWIIDGRVMVDLGYNHLVTLYDMDDVKGIALKQVKNKKKVALKILEN